MMLHGDWTGTNWALMTLLMLVFWTLVAAGVLWFISTRRHGGPTAPQPSKSPPAPDGSAARAILDERLARGELSAEEYQARRELLTPR
jgi:putative membrane protein